MSNNFLWKPRGNFQSPLIALTLSFSPYLQSPKAAFPQLLVCSPTTVADSTALYLNHISNLISSAFEHLRLFLMMHTLKRRKQYCFTVSLNSICTTAIVVTKDTKTSYLLHKIDHSFYYCWFWVEMVGNTLTTLETFCKTRKQMTRALFIKGIGWKSRAVKNTLEFLYINIRYLIDWESSMETCLQQSLMVRLSFWSLEQLGQLYKTLRQTSYD